MRCAVCGSTTPDVQRWATNGGTDYGSACRGECAGLLWEAHYTRQTGGTEFEHALVLWRWRRRRAEMEGKPFTMAPPESSTEVELRRLIEARGWAADARELS